MKPTPFPALSGAPLNPKLGEISNLDDLYLLDFVGRPAGLTIERRYKKKDAVKETYPATLVGVGTNRFQLLRYAWYGVLIALVINEALQTRYTFARFMGQARWSIPSPYGSKTRSLLWTPYIFPETL